MQSTAQADTINSGSGNDTINVSSNAPTNTGNARSISALTVDPQGGTNSVVLGDSADTTGRTVVVSHSGTLDTITGLTQGTFQCVDSTTNTITLDGGSGGNTFNVQSIGQSATINSGSGNDTINVAPSGNNLNAIAGQLTLDGQSGSNVLSVSDSSGTSTDVLTVSGSTIDDSGTANSIGYAATGGTFSALTVSAPTIALSGSITTVGTQTYTGSVTLATSTVNLSATTTTVTGSLTLGPTAGTATDTLDVSGAIDISTSLTSTIGPTSYGNIQATSTTIASGTTFALSYATSAVPGTLSNFVQNVTTGNTFTNVPGPTITFGSFHYDVSYLGTSSSLTGGSDFVLERPTLTSVSPNSGSSAGGTAITIDGTGFLSATGATVGGAALTNFTVVNDTTITGTTSAGGAGLDDVVVITAAGNATLSNGFTFVAAPAGAPPVTPAATGNVVINDETAGDTLTLVQTNATATVGDVTYILGNQAPVTLTGVITFTFNGNGGNDTMIVQFPTATAGVLLSGIIAFQAGPGTPNTLTIEANGQPVQSQPGSVVGGNLQRVNYTNVTTTNINNAGSDNTISGPNTADRTNAFTDLTAPERFVQALYLDELGRAGSLSELEGWVGVLNANSSTVVAADLASSAEATDHLVQTWYQTYLGRTPSNGEELGWVAMLRRGVTEESVLSGILGGSEFFNRAQTLEASGTPQERYVQALYQLLLGRAGKPSEVQGWVGDLSQMGQLGVASNILQSRESRTDLVEGYYNVLVHRPGDQSGLQFWGFSNEDAFTIRIGFEASAEFFANG